MSEENQFIDRKSLRKVTGQTADWKELAKDCVCFANARGGSILIGIEDGASGPPAGQIIPWDLPGKIHKRIGELTVNVTVAAEIKIVPNKAEHIELRVLKSHSAASTTDGHYYMRISDNCKPLVGDDIQRLLNERSAQPWETLTAIKITRNRIDQAKLAAFVAGIRRSSRIKESVKEKSDKELLDHYHMVEGPVLTNLGVLLLCGSTERATLGLLAQTEGLTARDLTRKLELMSPDNLEPWLGRLVDLDIVKSTGRTNAKRYFVPPYLLAEAGVSLKTTLQRIEPHRLAELVLEDIRRYPDTRIGEIHKRVGKEISRSMLKRTLAALVQSGRIRLEGIRGGVKYRLPG